MAMKPIDTRESESQTSSKPAPDFDAAMSAAVKQGATQPEMLLRLARSRQTETLQYCIRRMVDPNLSISEELVIASLLQETGMVPQFIEGLLSLDPECSRALATKFHNADRGFDMKVAVFLQSNDANVVMRSLDLLGVIGESKQLVPLLFAMLEYKDPKIQSKAALVIQKLDTELTFTDRLMKHKDARVRANTLQALTERADARAMEFLRRGAADHDNRVRTLAAVGLTRIGDPLGMIVLSKMIQHPTPVERRSAAWGLGRCGSPDALALLEAAASDADARVRELSAAGIQTIRERSSPDLMADKQSSVQSS